MPKPFLLGIEVEEIALGTIMRKLNAMPGVVKLHMDFRPGKPAAKPNGAGRHKNQFEDTGEAAILKMLKGGKTLRHQELRQKFAEAGRSPKSVNSLVHNMKTEGLLIGGGKQGWKLSGKAKRS